MPKSKSKVDSKPKLPQKLIKTTQNEELETIDDLIEKISKAEKSSQATKKSS